MERQFKLDNFKWAVLADNNTIDPIEFDLDKFLKDNPVKPTEPVAPVKPVEPTTPVKPVEPTTPVKPVEPTTPVKPVEPTTPVSNKGEKNKAELLPNTGIDSTNTTVLGLSLITLIGLAVRRKLSN